MTEVTYDPKTDAVYFLIAAGEVTGNEEAGPFIYDVDAHGRIVGIEILSASKILAPGDWQTAPPPPAD